MLEELSCYHKFLCSVCVDLINHILHATQTPCSLVIRVHVCKHVGCTGVRYFLTYRCACFVCIKDSAYRSFVCMCS